MWSVIATWPFSLQATVEAEKILQGGGNAVDAAERGIWLVESDPFVESVGKGGFLNENGELELDAAIMDGNTMGMGSVMSVKGFEHPVTIARNVMEHTKHSIIAGSGAEAFARKSGIKECGMEALITDSAREAYEKELAKGHDTIGIVTLDETGRIVVATSTSGAAMKIPGRVGDSPIIGSGFYAESGVGGAAATGLGEDIMRTCLSFRCVEMMGKGMSPQEAAEYVILTAHQKLIDHGRKPDCLALVCMNAAGEFGGACNHKGFVYTGASGTKAAKVYEGKIAIDKDAE